MDKVLKPEHLDVDPGSTQATAEFNHWFQTFTHYLDALQNADVQHSKLHILVNLISFNVYQHIANINDYDNAIQILKDLYVKPRNVIAARHELRMCKQQASKTIDQFVLRLKKLSKECDCNNVTGEQYRSELMRDAFIAGMLSVPIRQRLLKNRELTFRQAYEQARAQEMAHKNAETFKEPITVCSSTSLKDGSSADGDEANFLQAALRLKRTCYFCGQQNHPRNACPAKEAACNYCNKVGHFSRVCRKRLSNRRTQKTDSSSSAAAICESNLATISASAANNSTQVLCGVTLNGNSAESLMDTGSSDCYIDKRFAERHFFKILPALGEVTLVETSVRMLICGQCTAALTIKGNDYSDVVFNVLNNLATDVIIGEKIFKQHEKVVFSFEGDCPTLTLKALSKMIVPYP